MWASKVAKRKSIILFGTIIVLAVFQAFCQNDKVAKSTDKAATAVVEKTPNATDESTTNPQNAQKKLVVYYFYTTARCYSCNMIENLTKTAVQEGFKDLVGKGCIEFKALNIESPGNEHFVQDYKLYTKSVIMSDLQSGKESRWKNLDQVWVLLRDESKFIDYVKREVKTYLEG